MIESIFLLSCLLLTTLYGIIIIFCISGLKKKQPASFQYKYPSSLIIPFRNEANNLPQLLQAIAKQKKPDSPIEIIFVDDHSTDNGANLILNTLPILPFKSTLIHLPQHLSGKKAALHFGINKAQYPWIIITDADTSPQPLWLHSMSNRPSNKTQMILAPVFFIGHGLCATFQKLELTALTAVAMGSASINKPLMASGANMAFSKDAYHTIQPTIKGESYASGDDMFLLMAFIKTFGNQAISPLITPNAATCTHPAPHWKAFFKQRMRWTGKGPAYNNAPIIITAITVYLTNTMLIPATFLLPLSVSIPLWLFKTLIDSLLILPLLKMQHQTTLILYILPFQLFNALYNTLILPLSLIFPGNWKKRSTLTNHKVPCE